MKKVSTEELQQRKADAERQRLDAITVSRFQTKAALDDAGLLDDIETYMASDEVPRRVKLAWQEAQFKRGSRMVNDLAGEFGLSEQQLDELFLSAKEMEAERCPCQSHSTTSPTSSPPLVTPAQASLPQWVP